MRALARSSLINLGSRLMAVALGLALMLMTARMGPGVQGAFALFLAVESAMLAAGSGFGVALARRLSHHGEHPAELAVATVVACLLLGTAAAAALWWVSRWGGPSYAALAWLALAAPVMLVPGNLSGWWLGQGRMGPLAVLMVAPPALGLLGIGLAHGLALGGGLAVVLLAWVAARLVVALGAAWSVRREAGLVWPGLPSVRAAWGQEGRFVAVIGLTNLVSLLNYKVDLFLVERLLGLEPTGVYSIAVAVAELLWLLSSAVTTAAYARIGQPDRAAATALALRAMHTSVWLLLGLSPLLWWLASRWLPVLLGPAYAPAGAVLALLLPGVALYGAASALSAWFTNHAGRPQVPAWLAAGSLSINIVVSLWAIPRWGLHGAALATSLSYAVTITFGLALFVRATGATWGHVLSPRRLFSAT
jgi:O-antigen/teichoic acid export membrane protein